MTTRPKLSPAEARAVVDASENRLQDSVVDAVAKVVGREEAERLACLVYSRPEPAQQLTPRQLSLLKRAGKRRAWKPKARPLSRGPRPGPSGSRGRSAIKVKPVMNSFRRSSISRNLRKIIAGKVLMARVARCRRRAARAARRAERRAARMIENGGGVS